MRSKQAIEAGLEAAIFVPIIERAQLIGGLFLFSEKQRKQDQILLEILTAASNKIANEVKHRRTHDQLQSFFQLSGDLLCITDMNGYFKKINPSVSKLLGFSEEELLEHKVNTFIHEDDVQRTDDAVAWMLKHNNLKYFSNRFRCSNGDYKWLSWTATYSEDHQLIIAVARDITNDRAIQEELIYKDKLLSVIADAANSLIREDNFRTIIPDIIQRLGKVTSSDSVYLFENSKNKKGESVSSITYEWCSPDRKPQIDNPALKEMPFQFFADQLEGLKEGAVYSKTTDKVNNEGVRKLLENLGIKSILIVPLFVGPEFWGFVGFDDCSKPRVWNEMDKDVLKTFASSLASAIERNKTEEVILESEARFRHMSDNAPVMIWVSDENDNTIYTNKNWLDFTGVTVSGINKNSWASLVHPDDLKIAITDYDAQFKKRIPALLEYRLRTKNGDYRWVIDQATPRFLSDGTFLGYIGSVIDIHDRKLSEEKLSYQAHVLQEVTEAIISTDLDFTVITWNKGAEKIYG
jgi:PAS domain S-box-containing protein